MARFLKKLSDETLFFKEQSNMYFDRQFLYDGLTECAYTDESVSKLR